MAIYTIVVGGVGKNIESIKDDLDRDTKISTMAPSATKPVLLLKLSSPRPRAHKITSVPTICNPAKSIKSYKDERIFLVEDEIEASLLKAEISKTLNIALGPIHYCDICAPGQSDIV